MIDRKQFFRDTIWSLSSSLLTIVVGTILNILIGNYFSATGLGLYSIILTIYLILSIMGPIGIHSALVKYVSQFKGNQQKINQFISSALLFTLTTGVLLGLIAYLSADYLAKLFPQITGFSRAQRIVAISVPFFVLNKTILAFFNGLKRMKSYAVCESSRYVLILIFTILLGVLPRDIFGAIAAFPATEILLLILSFSLSKKLFNFDFSNLLHATKNLLSFGVQVVLSGVVGEINTRLDLLLIGYFLTDKDVGIYSISVMVARGMLIMPRAVQKISNPTLTEYYYKKQMPVIERLINTLMKYSFLLLSVSGIIFFFLFDDIIRIIFPGKTEFFSAFAPFQILLLGIILYGAFLSVGTSVSGSIGRPDISVKIVTVVLLVNAILNSILIPLWGIVGAAIATTIALILFFVIALILQRRLLKISVNFLYFIKGLVLLALVYFIYLLLSSLINLGFLLILSLGLFIGGCILVKIIDRNDLILLRELLPRGKRFHRPK